MRGHWREAVGLPGLGEDLLDGLGVQNAAAFESWLLSARRRLSTATESILHEAALATWRVASSNVPATWPCRRPC